jgi:hypothetical protein
MMEHTQHCPQCRYVGPTEYIKGVMLCPDCKQPLPFGGCCDGAEANESNETCKVPWQGEDVE